uniref:Uncharacterized protein n=1 Tax=Vespula pensylvanica TaxID=30213 RepID=A0A834KCN3_VESPE|nr:hypothetical protein H0235_014789 [Vespula pensylvanica]
MPKRRIVETRDTPTVVEKERGAAEDPDVIATVFFLSSSYMHEGACNATAAETTEGRIRKVGTVTPSLRYSDLARSA